MFHAFRRNGSIIEEDQNKLIFVSMDLNRDGEVSREEFYEEVKNVINSDIPTLVHQIKERREEAEAEERTRREK